MTNLIHFIEFVGLDGSSVIQRSDNISTILETTVANRAAALGPTKVMSLLLENGNRVQVVGETRKSIADKLRSEGRAVIMPREEDPAPAPAEAAE